MKNYHVYTCMKCEHSWGTANENPLRCPKCHTSKWNSPAVVRDAKEDAVICKLPSEVKERIYSAYSSGKSVINISIETRIAFGDVMDALLEKYPGANIKI